MTPYREAFEAGREYGKQYRRAHRACASDMSVARRAASERAGTYDMAGFIHGVLKGLQPFSSDDFAATFDRNAKLATYKAEAKLGGVRLYVMTSCAAHYQTTLAYWKEVDATVLSSSFESEEVQDLSVR